MFAVNFSSPALLPLLLALVEDLSTEVFEYDLVYLLSGECFLFLRLIADFVAVASFLFARTLLILTFLRDLDC